MEGSNREAHVPDTIGDVCVGEEASPSALEVLQKVPHVSAEGTNIDLNRVVPRDVIAMPVNDTVVSLSESSDYQLLSTSPPAIPEYPSSLHHRPRDLTPSDLNLIEHSHLFRSSYPLSEVNQDILKPGMTPPPPKSLSPIPNAISSDFDNAMAMDVVSNKTTQSADKTDVQEPPQFDTSDNSTEVDDAIYHDGESLQPPLHLVTTSLHLIDPKSPRVDYIVSENTPLAELQELKPASPTQPLWSPKLKYSISPTTGLAKIRERSPTPDEPSTSAPLSPTGSKWSITSIIGPNQEFPESLRAVLAVWHEGHPETQPPCSLRLRVNDVLQWGRFKVFDYDGEDHELSVFLISIEGRKRLKYCVMVLHAENGPDEIVSASRVRPKFKNTGFRGVYLVAWLGEEKGFESEVCAVRVWRTDGQKKVRFQAHFFDNAVGNISPARFSVSDNTADSSVRTPYGTSRRLNSLSSAPPWKNSPSTPRTPTNPADVIVIDSSSSDSTEPRVRRPGLIFDIESSGSSVARRLFTSPSARFKLISKAKSDVRHFPVVGCDIQSLFKKAREFYNESSNEGEMGLWCRIAGESERRYIGEACEDEYRMLCDDARQISMRNSRDQVIELEHASS